MGKKSKSGKVQKSKNTKSTKSTKVDKSKKISKGKKKKKELVKDIKIPTSRRVVVGNPVRCEKQKKVRRHLYYERDKLIKEISKGVPIKRQEWINNRLDKINADIELQTFKIFKCGKRYAKLRVEKNALSDKIRYLGRKLRNNPSMDKKEKNAILTSIGRYNERVRALKLIMDRVIVDSAETRSVSFKADEASNTTSELTTIWQIKEKVEGLIGSPDSKMVSITINGVLYDLKTNKIGAMWALDEYITDITLSQANSNVKTPMIQIIVDFNNFTVEIS